MRKLPPCYLETNPQHCHAGEVLDHARNLKTNVIVCLAYSKRDIGLGYINHCIADNNKSQTHYNHHEKDILLQSQVDYNMFNVKKYKTHASHYDSV